MREHTLIQLFFTMLLVYFLSVFPAAQAGTRNSAAVVEKDALISDFDVNYITAAKVEISYNRTNVPFEEGTGGAFVLDKTAQVNAQPNGHGSQTAFVIEVES